MAAQVDGPIGRWVASPPLDRAWPAALGGPLSGRGPMVAHPAPSRLPPSPVVARTVQGAPADWCTIFWWLC